MGCGCSADAPRSAQTRRSLRASSVELDRCQRSSENLQSVAPLHSASRPPVPRLTGSGNRFRVRQIQEPSSVSSLSIGSPAHSLHQHRPLEEGECGDLAARAHHPFPAAVSCGFTAEKNSENSAPPGSLPPNRIAANSDCSLTCDNHPASPPPVGALRHGAEPAHVVPFDCTDDSGNGGAPHQLDALEAPNLNPHHILVPHYTSQLYTAVVTPFSRSGDVSSVSHSVDYEDPLDFNQHAMVAFPNAAELAAAVFGSSSCASSMTAYDDPPLCRSYHSGSTRFTTATAATETAGPPRSLSGSLVESVLRHCRASAGPGSPRANCVPSLGAN